MVRSCGKTSFRSILFGALVAALAGCSDGGGEGRSDVAPAIPEPAAGYPGFASPQVQSIALSPDARELYVANTAADTLDIIDTETREVVFRVATGIDPASLAVRPDGREVWVSNHLSDSVSIVDVDPSSPTRYRLIATVQAFDDAGLVTDFDEPLGIAFADDTKAYVALSSRNRIAVVDVATRTVTNQIQVYAQEPRAITVRDGRLYVIPFESNNQTELSGCLSMSAASPDCTFLIIDVLLANSLDSILTRGFPANIIRNPQQPDRDLFVYDTATDRLIEEVSSIGTLLYGLAVDSEGRVFIAQTEARNTDNGQSAQGDDLIDLENRAFLNQIARLGCKDGCGAPTLIELEPELPEQPAQGMALATPFGLQISGDDTTLVGVAASSSRLFTMDAATGAVLGRAEVGAIPRSLVLESNRNGAPLRAWVFNAIEDSVSLVDVADPANPTEVTRIALDDPTDAVIKKGRIAFNDGDGSTSGTFSCESCHPDGNTDQLLWNLGAICLTEGCDQKIPRTTMPIRGLRDTLPLHWDGIPGDPFGGTNGELADSGEVEEPNCSDELSCFRDLVDGAMSGTMCDLNACPTNGDGLAGAFDEEERNAMAEFLMTVPYPPARSRQIDDQLSDMAADGFRVFLIGDDDDHPGCSRAGGCHAAPFWAGTNTPGSGMDAPTFRGLTDRHLLLPNGRSGMWDFVSRDGFNEVPWDPANGPDELYSWGLTFGTEILPIANRISTGRGPFELFQLFEETSTGFSGVFARQVTLGASGAPLGARETALLDRLEAVAADGLIDLRGNGTRANGDELVMLYRDGAYAVLDAEGEVSETLTRAELVEQAAAGEIIVTLTGRLGSVADAGNAQPALWLPRAEEGRPRDNFLQAFPVINDDPTFAVFGRHISPDAIVLLDGRAVDATLTCAAAGTFPACEDESIQIALAQKPSAGDHTFQVATPLGLISNELLMIVP
ncbi:MAG: hypothetical protein AAF436_04085 [Myxococcota bacterium]